MSEHTENKNRAKIYALIAAVQELMKDTQFEDMDQRTAYLKHRIESLKVLADEANTSLNSLLTEHQVELKLKGWPTSPVPALGESEDSNNGC